MINSRDINDLHPVLRRGAVELMGRMAAEGWDMGISATYRDKEYQDYLYGQGRTRSGDIVTNARGGESIHNYRLAFDIFNNVVGNLYPEAFLKVAGEIGEKMGMEWGGNWRSFPDRPHFQFTNGLTLSQLQHGALVPADAKMPWELEEKEKAGEENTVTIYQRIEEVPQWGQVVVQKLIDNGALQGDEAGLNLSYEMLRIFVVLNRLGVI